MEDLARVLSEHPFVAGLPEPQLRVIIGCTKNVRYAPGEYLSREDDEHEHALYLLRHGTIGVESASPGREPTVVETLVPGDVCGVSWMTPGVRTHLDCRARDNVLVFHIDGECLKRKMDADPTLGYAIASRLLASTYERLARARLQKLDLYG